MLADTTGVERVVGQGRERTVDAGSTLIEQLIAIGIVVTALLAFLGTLGAAARGVSTGRQRSIAVSLAKQTIENLQGAAYQNVAMNLSSPGLSGDLLVTGASPDLAFEDEALVPGSTTPYRVTTVAAGATFTSRTFITSVPSVIGAAYRRITVIIEWNASPSGSSSATVHRMRFASLVFPLNYSSYPASNGSAEATGGLIAVSGQLGGLTFDDVHVILQSARSDTNASTLRTSMGQASGSTSHIDVGVGAVAMSTCAASLEPDVTDCPAMTIDSVADNDGGSTTGNWSASANQPFAAGTLTSMGALKVGTPAGLLTARASTDACGVCGFGDSDGVPWAEAFVGTTTAASGAFASDHGLGGLSGDLWSFATAWRATTAVDHDPTGGGIVASSAELDAPALHVLDLDDAVVGFDGAVVIGAFAAHTSIAAGYSLAAPVISATAASVQLWDDTFGGYRPLNVVPGVPFDESATGSVVVGDHVVTFTSRVRSQPSTVSLVGASPRTDAVAQLPSLVLVSVDVTITSQSTLLVTDAFTVVVDYGRLSAHAEWMPEAG